MKIFLMRSPELPCFGEFSYKQIGIKEARGLISSGKFISAIKYQWGAGLLRDILGVYIPINRGEIRLEVGGVAVIFNFLEDIEEKEPLKRARKAPFSHGSTQENQLVIKILDVDRYVISYFSAAFIVAVFIVTVLC